MSSTFVLLSAEIIPFHGKKGIMLQCVARILSNYLPSTALYITFLMNQDYDKSNLCLIKLFNSPNFLMSFVVMILCLGYSYIACLTTTKSPRALVF